MTSQLSLEVLRGRLFLKVGEVAELMDTDPRTVRRAIEAGQIPAVKVSNTVRIPVPAFLSKVLGLPPDSSDAAPSQDAATATTTTSSPQEPSHDGHAHPTHTASVHPIRGA